MVLHLSVYSHWSLQNHSARWKLASHQTAAQFRSFLFPSLLMPVQVLATYCVPLRRDHLVLLETFVKHFFLSAQSLWHFIFCHPLGPGQCRLAASRHHDSTSVVHTLKPSLGPSSHSWHTWQYNVVRKNRLWCDIVLIWLHSNDEKGKTCWPSCAVASSLTWSHSPRCIRQSKMAILLNHPLLRPLCWEPLPLPLVTLEKSGGGSTGSACGPTSSFTSSESFAWLPLLYQVDSCLWYCLEEYQSWLSLWASTVSVFTFLLLGWTTSLGGVTGRLVLFASQSSEWKKEHLSWQSNFEGD